MATTEYAAGTTVPQTTAPPPWLLPVLLGSPVMRCLEITVVALILATLTVPIALLLNLPGDDVGLFTRFVYLVAFLVGLAAWGILLFKRFKGLERFIGRLELAVGRDLDGKNGIGNQGPRFVQLTRPASYEERLLAFTEQALAANNWSERRWIGRPLLGEQVDGDTYARFIADWEAAGILTGRGTKGDGKRGVLTVTSDEAMARLQGA